MPLFKTSTKIKKPNALDREPETPAKPGPKVKPILPMTRAEYEDIAKPRVLIAGGGIGGLTLAILLHRAGIAVSVLERAKVIYPLGSVMIMGPASAPLFKQLGMYEEFMERSKAVNSMTMCTENLDPISHMSWPWVKEYTGHNDRVISRPELYTILRGNIPSHQVITGKRILSFNQDDNGVNVRCADNSLYHADIIVGADGAYSAIRQNMYKDPEVAPTIPASDKGTLPFKCVCLVGQTIPLDPEDFPQLDEEYSQLSSVLDGSTMCTWLTATTAQNSVCWMMIQFMDKESFKRNDSFRTTEWGPESAEALAAEVRDFRVPGGRNGTELTLGDYLDKTPARHLSKVVLEEIVFEKWYHKRAVLLGDACHKFNPTGGQGAINAMHDAVCLANWLSTLRCADTKQFEAIFEEYRKERYPIALESYASSKMFRQNFAKNMMATVVRGMLKRMPTWLFRMMMTKNYRARPQASFLPLIKDVAKIMPSPQQSLIKTLPLLRKIVDDPDVLCIDSPEVIAKATAMKETEEARVAAALEAGLVIHTPAKSFPAGTSGPAAV
ncbi:hypothetical protein BG004_007262 [Podila humilis]|nr:hypothetical protein BG004_007262 [Podila humilis]